MRSAWACVTEGTARMMIIIMVHVVYVCVVATQSWPWMSLGHCSKADRLVDCMASCASPIIMMTVCTVAVSEQSVSVSVCVMSDLRCDVA